MSENNVYDSVIIGSGPAGISASIYSIRGGLNTVVISKDMGALEKADKIENFYGFAEIISGKELLENGINQYKRLGGKLMSEEVVGIADTGGFIYEITTNKSKYLSKSVIIATGRGEAKIRKDFLPFEGKGLSFCAICDAFFYRNKNVAVLGTGEYALHEITALTKSSKIYLLTDGKEPENIFPQNIEIIKSKISTLVSDDDGMLKSVKFDDNSEIFISGLFFAGKSADGAGLARSLGLIIEDGKIKTDSNMKTNLNGIFAAGDTVGGVMQISVTVGEGAVAGLSAVGYVKKLNR